MSELPDLDQFGDRVLWLVKQVPEGNVATYGQIALYAGGNGAARAVGNLLRNHGATLPWQRIINATGGISIRGDLARPLIQRELLEDEGIEFKGNGKCDLPSFLWQPLQIFWS